MPNWQRRIRKFASEKVLADWRYKLIALGSAIVIWAYVAGQQTIQAVYTAPVFFQNIPQGLVLVNRNRIEVEVTIAGPRDRVQGLKDRQISVSLDLSKMKPGRNPHRFAKEDFQIPRGLEIKAFFPRQIVIQLSPEPEGQP